MTLRFHGLAIAMAMFLGGCPGPTEKIVSIPGPEVIRLVPAKTDHRLLHCMDVDAPSVDLIPVGMDPAMVAAVLGVVANRYELAWKDCKGKLKAIEDTENQAGEP